MLQKIRNRKGFTLVELMIVVAIIGILAAIAIPNFLQFRLKAKTSEGKSNLGAIRSTEVAYFAEWGGYLGNQTPYPVLDRAGKPNKQAWAVPDGATVDTQFLAMGFKPEGSVFYSYALNGIAYQTSGMSMIAIADLDNDASRSTFYVTDATNEIVRDGDDY